MGDLASLVGRPPTRQAHAGKVREAEGKIADRLPELVDLLMEMALGRKPERCTVHPMDILECPTCHERSHGSPANQSALTYAINRVAGTPTVAGEQRVNLDFVNRIAKHIAEAFTAVNLLPTPEERREQFAMRMAEIWVLIGETS